MSGRRVVKALNALALVSLLALWTLWLIVGRSSAFELRALVVLTTGALPFLAALRALRAGGSSSGRVVACGVNVAFLTLALALILGAATGVAGSPVLTLVMLPAAMVLLTNALVLGRWVHAVGG